MLKLLSVLVLTLALCAPEADASAKKKKKKPERSAHDLQCLKIIKKAEAECDKQICDDAKEEGETADCERDGDFRVMLQECAYPVIEERVAEYNEKHPNKKLDCQDVEEWSLLKLKRKNPEPIALGFFVF